MSFHLIFGCHFKRTKARGSLPNSGPVRISGDAALVIPLMGTQIQLLSWIKHHGKPDGWCPSRQIVALCLFLLLLLLFFWGGVPTKVQAGWDMLGLLPLLCFSQPEQLQHATLHTRKNSPRHTQEQGSSRANYAFSMKFAFDTGLCVHVLKPVAVFIWAGRTDYSLHCDCPTDNIAPSSIF